MGIIVQGFWGLGFRGFGVWGKEVLNLGLGVWVVRFWDFRFWASFMV